MVSLIAISIKELGIPLEFRGPELEPLSNLLELNGGTDKRFIAMQKILVHHPSFDMEPLFEWNLKLLPNLVTWYNKAVACNVKGTEAQKLDSIYQFTKAMPMKFVQPRPKKSWLSRNLDIATLSYLFKRLKTCKQALIWNGALFFLAYCMCLLGLFGEGMGTMESVAFAVAITLCSIILY